MLEMWDYVNLIGILLEIIGFILLLSRFQDSIVKALQLIINGLYSKRVYDIEENKATLIEDSTKWDKNKIKSLQNYRDITGILLVVIGLVCQFTSILVEKLSSL